MGRWWGVLKRLKPHPSHAALGMRCFLGEIDKTKRTYRMKPACRKLTVSVTVTLADAIK